ncbi:hypothetical protein LOK49_LG03G02640 [Camellia lanceoleosa]|uniref:Uncharacterized protein n=1 Tax=Camellia lanceoleosa TaxID=1840588 RepID=A0ACC0IAU2_9ERIC|nr:hypothetical protein LOK49_LG03G02640 [Camellia lanceoleosa]
MIITRKKFCQRKSAIDLCLRVYPQANETLAIRASDSEVVSSIAGFKIWVFEVKGYWFLVSCLFCNQFLSSSL